MLTLNLTIKAEWPDWAILKCLGEQIGLLFTQVYWSHWMWKPSQATISFSFFFQTNITIFITNRYMGRNVHPVYGAGILTHNLQNTSLLPKPLDQGSRLGVFYPSIPPPWRQAITKTKHTTTSSRKREGSFNEWASLYMEIVYFEGVWVWVCV